MLARRRPYEGPSREELVEQIVKAVPPPVSQFNPAVSIAVSQVVHKAMAKQPYYRFGSVKEFAESHRKPYRKEPNEIYRPERNEPRIQRAKQAKQHSENE